MWYNEREEKRCLNSFSSITGLLHRLCVMLTLTTIPADVLAEVSVEVSRFL